MKRFRDTQYFVTENGDVFRKWGDVYKPLKQEFNQGYYRVTLSINNQQTRYRVNRLVAECYIPNPENKPVVNHMDTNKLNNHYTNLEWSTDRENKDHAIENGLYPRGEEHTNILLTEQVIWIRQNYKKGDKELGSRPLSRRFNVSRGCINGVIHNRTWKHLIPNQPS